MRYRALAASAWAATAIVAGAQPAPGHGCDPENAHDLGGKDKQAFERAFRREPRMTEMQLYLGAPSSVVQARVLDAMLKCQMPVRHSTGGVIEADYGRHTGFLGRYRVKARVYVVSVDDTTTRVRFAGEETAEMGNALNPLVSTHRIAHKNTGVSGGAWIAMRNVFKQLLADTTLRANRDLSTPLATQLLVRGDTSPAPAPAR